jgi:hypothetical protein
MTRRRGRVRFSYVLLFLTVCIAGPTATQTVASPSTSCDSSTVDDWGQKEATKARAFLTALQSVVRADNRTKLATMVLYPLNVFAADGKRVIHNRSEFIQKYPSIFTPHVRQTVLKQSSDCLFGNAEGAMVGNGEIWFTEQPTNAFKIITVNLSEK